MPPKSQYCTSFAPWGLTHFLLFPRVQGASFTFLSQDPEDDADSTAEEHSHVGAVEEIKTNPWQTTTKLPYDSSDENEDGDDVDFEDAAVHNDIQSSKSTSHLDELFFFHPDDPKLANRINGEMSQMNKLLNCFGEVNRAVLLYLVILCTVWYSIEWTYFTSCCDYRKVQKNT